MALPKRETSDNYSGLLIRYIESANCDFIYHYTLCNIQPLLPLSFAFKLPMRGFFLVVKKNIRNLSSMYFYTCASEFYSHRELREAV